MKPFFTLLFALITSASLLAQVPADSLPFKKANAIFIVSDTTEDARYLIAGRSLTTLGYTIRQSDPLFKTLSTEMFKLQSTSSIAMSITATILPGGIRLTAKPTDASAQRYRLENSVPLVQYNPSVRSWRVTFEELERVARAIKERLKAKGLRYGTI